MITRGRSRGGWERRSGRSRYPLRARARPRPKVRATHRQPAREHGEESIRAAWSNLAARTSIRLVCLRRPAQSGLGSRSSGPEAEEEEEDRIGESGPHCRCEPSSRRRAFRYFARWAFRSSPSSGWPTSFCRCAACVWMKSWFTVVAGMSSISAGGCRDARPRAVPSSLQR